MFAACALPTVGAMRDKPADHGSGSGGDDEHQPELVVPVAEHPTDSDFPSVVDTECGQRGKDDACDYCSCCAPRVVDSCKPNLIVRLSVHE